jgi:uncharacterized protein YqgC (DUF456 family)
VSAGVVIVIVFAVIGLCCVLTVAFGLPGVWILLALAFGIELADGLWVEGGTTTFGWGWLLFATALGGLGELVEFGASAVGVKKGGGSKRGAIGSVIGGILGALFLTFLIPIPVLGSLIGALLGTFIGALVGELSAPQPLEAKEAVKPALWATLATVVGNAIKTGLALVALVVLLTAALYRHT